MTSASDSEFLCHSGFTQLIAFKPHNCHCLPANHGQTANVPGHEWTCAGTGHLWYHIKDFLHTCHLIDGFCSKFAFCLQHEKLGSLDYNKNYLLPRNASDFCLFQKTKIWRWERRKIALQHIRKTVFFTAVLIHLKIFLLWNVIPHTSLRVAYNTNIIIQIKTKR